MLAAVAYPRHADDVSPDCARAMPAAAQAFLRTLSLAKNSIVGKN
jgi:hypothetical protein